MQRKDNPRFEMLFVGDIYIQKESKNYSKLYQIGLFICSADIAFISFYYCFSHGKPYSVAAGSLCASCVCSVETVKKPIWRHVWQLIAFIFDLQERMFAV